MTTKKDESKEDQGHVAQGGETYEPKTEQSAETKASPCPTCDGRGVRPEISVSELCPKCGGSGTIKS